MATLLSPFYQKLSELPREELLTVIEAQDVTLIKQVNRIEWVFRNKLQHLHWADGTPVTERDLTTEELSLLIDEPFSPKNEWTELGLTIEQQRQLHTAQDPVLWAKNFLKIEPRVYQILMLRYPSLRRVLRSGRRIGKALDIETPIPTPLGWRTMKELEIGDQVFDEDGHICQVIGTTDVQYDRTCFKISFSDGNSIIADADHQWTVDTKKSRKARGRAKTPVNRQITLTTEEMLDELYVWSGGKFEANYSIEVASPVQYAEKNLPISPWLLGLWLADGTGNSGVITIGDEDGKEVLDRINNYGYNYTRVPSAKIAYNIEGLYPKLNLLDVLRKYKKTNPISGVIYPDNMVRKFIPKVYLQGSVSQRVELLKGLMDGDGTVGENGCCEFCVTNEQLAMDFYELVQSLGFRATFKVSDAVLDGRVVGLRYRIVFTPWTPVFHLHRKLILQKLGDKPSARQRCRYITNIEPVASVPVKCIEVNSKSRLYLAGKNFIPTHNSFTMSILMLHWAYTHNLAKVLVVAPMKAHVELLYDAVLELAKNNSVVYNSIRRKVKSPQFAIELSNGSTIRFFTSGLRSGGRADIVRGQEAHLIILDELDFMHPDDLISIYAMLQQTQEGQEPKVLVGASTPTGRKENFYEWCISDAFKEFWYPSYVNPNWTQETETEFRRQYITELSYRHEVEADWGDNAEGVYPIRLVDWAFKSPGWRYNSVPRPKPRDSETFYVMGVDWDKYSAGVNICVLEVCDVNYPEERFRNKVRLAFREETLREEYTLSKGIMRVIELNAIMGDTLRHIYIDRGNGEVQSEQLSKYGVDNPHSGLKQKLRPVQFAENLEMRDPATQEIVKKDIKPFMIDNLRQFLEQDHICFPEDDEELYRQLISYEVARITPTGKPIFEMAGGRPDHAHDALILACLAITENYGELMRQRFAMRGAVVSNEAFLPMFGLSDNPDVREWEIEKAQEIYGSLTAAPLAQKRAMTVRLRNSSARPVKRSMF